ncbi:hypothetical protein OEZ85_008364 [Tetradesmus obliquus]|uniref:Uncharacterized protein n=1 Tax=Tetradesmus obliquus TaxID=3088 RepID=A0ABY8TIM9_TETOB|nr:hypothetical protein OEZ85_008364 [Tetradesmus obliquus]
MFSTLRSHTDVLQIAGPLEQQLASLTRLTSLSFSGGDLKRLGHLKRAHMVEQQAAGHGSRTPFRYSYFKHKEEDYDGLARDSRFSVYWLPDWLAAAPGLTSLAIKPLKRSSSSSSSSSSSGSSSNSSSSSGSSSGSSSSSSDDEDFDRRRMPACLWMSAALWPSKLEALHIESIPLGSWLPPCIPQLTGLTCLRLPSCSLQPRAAAVLWRQSRSSWKALQVLDLSDNALEQLPSEGWEWLSGLKELDLSCTSLSWLPGAISSLAGLTALRLSQTSGLESLPQELTALSKLAVFDASDNFMNGLGLEVSLASLAAAWPHLQWLALENTSSDFNGSLALPQELAGCSRLQELRLGWNQDLDWGSLQVLQQCTALRVLDLEGIGNAPPAAARPGLRQLLAQLRPRVAVNLGGRWI